MSAKNTFFQHYRMAVGKNEAPQGLIKAACLYVLDLRVAGLSLDDVTSRVQELIKSAGGMVPETTALDADIMLHCVEEYHRPAPPPFLG
jgi:hypothetical protein